MGASRKDNNVLRSKQSDNSNSNGKNAKPSHSIAGLFDHPRNKRRKLNDATAAASTSTAHFKQYSSSKLGEDHPSYISFSQAANAYRQGATVSTAAELTPVFESLCARIGGLNVDSLTTTRPSTPELQALEADELALCRNLGDEEMTLRIPLPGGGSKLEQVKLGDTMAAFEMLLERKKGEVSTIQAQLKRIDEEIAAVKDDIVNDGDGAERCAKEALDAAVLQLEERMRVSRAQGLAEIKKAQKEDKAANAANSRKIQEFLMALQ